MRKNVAGQHVAFQMVSVTDGSDVTSGAPTVYYTIDAGTQGTGGGASVHEGNGQWSYAPAQAETNGNHVAFTMVLSGAISQTVNVYPLATDLQTTATPTVNTTLIEGADPSDTIRDAVVDDATRIDASVLNTAATAVGSNGSGLTEAGGTGDHLTAIDLPNQTFDLTGNITGNLSGSVGGIAGTITTLDALDTAQDTQHGTTQSSLSTVGTNVSTLLTRIPAALFSGITSLANWLGLIAAKHTGDTTARTELNATGAGSGTYNETTDSGEAVRDRGDAAWTTATGFSTHSAADVWSAATRVLTAGTNIVLAKGTGVTGFNDLDAAGIRTAVGMSSANLDTQLGKADLTATVPDSIPADGDRPTVQQAAYMIVQTLTEFAISGTTITVKKPDGSTTLFTITMDDATDPTSATRAS